MYGVTLIHPQRVAIYTERVAVAAGLGVLANNNLRFHHRNKGAYGNWYGIDLYAHYNWYGINLHEYKWKHYLNRKQIKITTELYFWSSVYNR